MSDFGVYRGDEFLAMEMKQREFIIDNIIKEKDTVMFVGDEKAGKSLMILQMICSLTSQHMFLDKYEVKKQCKVSYLQLEGELQETQDRTKRLMKSLDFVPELFQILFLGPTNIEENQIVKGLLTKYLIPHKPDVLIIDPLYQAMTGSLSDDSAVRKFLGNIRIMKDTLGCAVIIVHHTHKILRDRDGFPITEGDEATFGSKFLKAYPDHILLFSCDKATGERALTCATQRSGDIEKHIKLRLVEPNPLYFEEVDPDAFTSERMLYDLLLAHPEGMTGEAIREELKISKRTFFRSLKTQVGLLIDKTLSNPKVYKVKSAKSAT